MLWISISFPFKVIFPLVAGASPNNASPSSPRPEPRSPVIPSTSPFSSENDTFSNAPSLEIFSTFKISVPSLFSGTYTDSTISRPVISWINLALSYSLISPLEIYSPFRIIVSLSAISYISSSLWLTIIIAIPFSFKRRMILNRFSTSFLVSAVVGSSRIRNFASLIMVRHIATICLLATVSLSTRISGSM